MSAPYVVLERTGLVHEVCIYCRGDGKSEFYIGERPRETVCGYCCGKGFVTSESPMDAHDLRGGATCKA